MKYTNYTNKEINNLSSNKIMIPLDSYDVIRFVFNSFIALNNNKLYISKINKRSANAIMILYGICVYNYNISLRADNVRKIFKSHGDMINEYLRGQELISIDDFVVIKDIINDPDIIVLSEKRTPEGKSVLLFQKKINNNIYVVVNVSDKHHNLEIQTMYKKRTLPL
jgi:hypothetical protein